nr:MAG TPA: hypothetical protein [Caudoviricetes sp.]
MLFILLQRRTKVLLFYCILHCCFIIVAYNANF